MTDKLHLDVETYSELDVTKVGAYKCLGHPSAEIMLAQFALNDNEVTVIDFVEMAHADGHADVGAAFSRGWLREALSGTDLWVYLLDPSVEIHAFNAAFERIAVRRVWDLHLPISRFRCTMVHAYSLGFFGGMSGVGEQMGLAEDKKKLTTGKALIRRFCGPAPGSHRADRYDRRSHPVEWEQFKVYGRRDVVTEREEGRLLEPYPLREREQRLYALDQKINDYGVLIDIDGVDGAIQMDAETKAQLLVDATEMIGIKNVNSRQQLLAWLEAQGLVLDDLRSATVEEAVVNLEKSGENPLMSAVLRIKQKIALTSITKYKAFKRATDELTCRFRGSLQFFGAQRTGRWAARLVQLHNLARPVIEHPEEKAWALALGDRGLVHELYGDVSDYLKSCIRCVIVAPENKSLVISDFASVESRFVAWMSNCKRMMNLFAEGKDSYKDFASAFYGVPYNEVTSAMRKWCKPPVLGCFAGDTEVLTSSGFKMIIHVDPTDLLWDGVEWVGHEGVAHQGLKVVARHHGVGATPDHLVLAEVCGSQKDVWRPWGRLYGDRIDSSVIPPLRGFDTSMSPSVRRNQSPHLTRTYDILNAGPRSRFTIRTSAGLVIAHNCAYQLGAGDEKKLEGGLLDYAKGMGVHMSYEESKLAVDTFREMHPEIVEMWYWLAEACMEVIERGVVRKGYKVEISRDNNFMFIKLPSGRKISYFKPLIEMRVPPWEMNKEPEEVLQTDPLTGEEMLVWITPKPKLRRTITYMGKSKMGNKWVRLTTHGGKITENICQAGCMDLLGDAMTSLDMETDHPICLHVHDEVAQEVPDDESDEHLAYMNNVLSRPVDWAPGLLLDAAGMVTKRFTKD